MSLTITFEDTAIGVLMTNTPEVKAAITKIEKGEAVSSAEMIAASVWMNLSDFGDKMARMEAEADKAPEAPAEASAAEEKPCEGDCSNCTHCGNRTVH